MSIREILVCVQPTAVSFAHIDGAAHIAADQGARLTILFVQPERDIPLTARLQDETIDKRLETEEQDIARRVRRTVEERIAHLGISQRWLEAIGPVEPHLSRQANVTDLIVLEGFSSSGSHGMVNPLIVSQVMASGRAVLAIPPSMSGRTVGRTILVAWDGSRESSRALRDSLPLLTKADRVVVLTVIAPDSKLLVDGEGMVGDIGTYLRDRGIKALPSVVRLSIGTGPFETILEQAQRVGADLLVMGAFGRGRLQEMVLGSITHAALKNWNGAVLVSH